MSLHVKRLVARINTQHPSGCWVFTGTPTAAGYGQVSIKGQFFYTHRLAYELFIGPIPDGLEVDHLCRNRLCCNPAHLEAVTHEQNMARAEARGVPGNNHACRANRLRKAATALAPAS